jgi:hypothetical protein
MTVKIKQVVECISKTSKAGKPYTLTSFMSEDGKFYKEVYGKFEVGQEIEGEWKKDDYGNDRFEVARQGGQYSKARFEDPAKQGSIERQNALSNAITYCTAKAQLLAGKTKVSIDAQLSGKHIIEVAALFSAYNAGKITPDMTPDVIAKIWDKEPVEAPKVQVEPEVPQDEPSATPDDQSDINVDEIPF